MMVLRLFGLLLLCVHSGCRTEALFEWEFRAKVVAPKKEECSDFYVAVNDFIEPYRLEAESFATDSFGVPVTFDVKTTTHSAFDKETTLRGVEFRVLRYFGRFEATRADEGFKVNVLLNLPEKVAAVYGPILAHVFHHEVTEFALVYDELLGVSLYKNAMNARWIGDGLAELMSTTCVMRSRYIEDVDSVSKKGIRELDLSKWRSGDQLEGIPANVCYVAAHRTMDRWRSAMWVDRKGALRLITNFLRSEISHPTYEEILNWMSYVSGLDMTYEASHVSLVDLCEWLESNVSDAEPRWPILAKCGAPDS